MRRILPILLLALVAACTKDKDPDRPVKLVAFPEGLKIEKLWSAKVGGTKVPLRLVIFGGFMSAFISFVLGMFYLVYKLIFWRSFTVGVAPVVLGLFFLGSVQLIALGIIGEYVGSIHTLVLNRPLVTDPLVKIDGTLRGLRLEIRCCVIDSKRHTDPLHLSWV